MLNENTCRIIYKNTCISGKTLSRKYVYIILSKMLSEIGVYSIIPTFSISSDFHTYWVLISHFYSQHTASMEFSVLKTEPIYSGIISLTPHSTS